MPYNLEYHKQLDRSHILPNILNGAQTGITSQFLSDLFISLFLYNETIVIKDIQISSIPSYYAAAATGMLAGFLIIYLDPIAVIAFTTVFYDFVFEIVDYKLNGDPIVMTPVEETFDIGLTMLLIIVFDPTARHQYLRYQQKRHFIEPTLVRQDRSPTLAIFITVLTSTYGFLKLTSSQNEESNSKTES